MKDALDCLRLMNGSSKSKSKQNLPDSVVRNSHLVWWFVAIAILGLVVLAATRYRRPFNSAKGGSSGSAHSNSVAGSALKVAAPETPAAGNSTNGTETTDADKATEDQNLGNALLAQGKIDEAIIRFQEAIKLNPEDEDAHYNYALALARQGNRDAAKQQYLEALRIYPDYSEAHNNLGNLLVSMGELNEAIEHFRAALKISPEQASVQNNLGNALARQGKVADAIPYFREAIHLKPDYIEARYNLGSAHLAQGRIDDAIAEFSDVLRQHPDFAPAQRGLAKARQLQLK